MNPTITPAMADPAVQSIPIITPKKNSSVPSPEFRGEFINATPQHLDQLHHEWEQLAREMTHREPFFLPYWFRSFAKTIAAGESIPMVLVRDKGRLRGVLPLRRTGRFLRKVPGKVLASLSNVHSCRFDFLCGQEYRDAIARAAWRALKDETSWNVVEVNAIPEGGAFEAIMRCAEADGYMTSRWPTLLSPYLPLPAEGSDPFGNCPSQYKKDRKRIEKRFERLREHGDPRFEVVSEFNEDRFQEFLALEASGWKGLAGSAIRCDPTLVEFYRELLAVAANEGHLRMCALRVGQHAVAMELSFLVDGRCYSPKIAYDERYSASSPGQQLARLIIEDLVQRGVSYYDLLGPRARYKALWTGEVRPHANCYIFRPSVAGRLSYYLVDKIGPQVKRAKYARHGDPQSL